MLKLIKNFGKREWVLVFVSIILIFSQVWLELKMPDYMAEITRLVQTEGSKMEDILLNGSLMMLCAFGSLIFAIIVGYLIANLAASFSKKIRKKLFSKVEDLSLNEIKKFSTSSLITNNKSTNYSYLGNH